MRAPPENPAAYRSIDAVAVYIFTHMQRPQLHLARLRLIVLIMRAFGKSSARIALRR
jgi:hypothetical protein